MPYNSKSRDCDKAMLIHTKVPEMFCDKATDSDLQVGQHT